MTKGKFDTRTWVEIVGDLVIARTSQGDSIKLTVKFNGAKKPTVKLIFTSAGEKEFSTGMYLKNPGVTEEDITDWIDETPYYDIIDDSTGKPVPGESRRGSDWREYIDVRFGPLVQSIVKSGGRLFAYEEIK